MKIEKADLVNENGRKLPKVPRSIVRVFINFIAFTNWKTLLSVHDSARLK